MIKIVLSVVAVILLGVVSLIMFQASTAPNPLNTSARDTTEGELGMQDKIADARESEAENVPPQLNIEGLEREVPEEKVPEPRISYAPEFTLPRIDGTEGTVSLADYRGEKPVIIDFFAPHCPNCRRNIVTQKPLYEKYKDQIEIVIIGIDPEPMNSDYFAKNPVAMPVVYDASGQVLRDYGIRFTNTHALINKDGSLHDIVYDDLREDYINELLNK